MTEIPLTPSRPEFLVLAKKGNLIPVYTEFVADYETPVSVFEKIDNGSRSFLLESADIHDHVGRYSFLASSPRVYFERRGRKLRIEENGETRDFETATDPLAELRKLLDRYTFVGVAGRPPFVGGAVGYIGYDMVRFCEPSVTPSPPDQLGIPDSAFMITDTFLVFDHRFRRLKIFATAFVSESGPEAAYDEAREKISAILQRLEAPTEARMMNAAALESALQTKANTEEADFCDIVRRCQEHIQAGDVFQIVPSLRFEVQYPGRSLPLYRALRFINPSPYLFCLQLSERFALVGSSPEVHVRLRDGKVEIRPLAGTGRRGATPDEDQQMAPELFKKSKKGAEAFVLVGLPRHNVGPSSRFWSIQNGAFMTYVPCSH